MYIEFRRAGDTEADDLTAIAFAAKRHWDYPEAWIEAWSDELTVDADYIGKNRVFVATDGRGVLGWYALSGDADDHWLDFCWVLPEAIGQGIGRRLVSHAFSQAARLGWPALKVIADPNAEGFYRKLGFRRIGDHPSVPEGRRLPLLESVVLVPTNGEPQQKTDAR